jgi:hypothetical protein
MRVSFRRPTEEGLVSREIQDWRNTILQVWNRVGDASEVDQKQLNVSIDFQSYFVPERQYNADLLEDHYRRFVERLEQLQTGRLAGLAGSEQVSR